MGVGTVQESDCLLRTLVARMSARTCWAAVAEVAVRRPSRTLLEVVRIQQVGAPAGESSHHMVVGSGRFHQGRTTAQEGPGAAEGLHPTAAGAMAPATTLQVAGSSTAPKRVHRDVAPDVQVEGQDVPLGCEIRVSTVCPSALRVHRWNTQTAGDWSYQVQGAAACFEVESLCSREAPVVVPTLLTLQMLPVTGKGRQGHHLVLLFSGVEGDQRLCDG